MTPRVPERTRKKTDKGMGAETSEVRGSLGRSVEQEYLGVYIGQEKTEPRERYLPIKEVRSQPI